MPTSPSDFPAGAALPREDRFRPRGTVRGSRRGRWRALVLIAVHVVFVVHFAHWKIAGETVTPMEPSEAMWTLELGYVNAGFLVLGLSILVTAVLGRFFCGWLCHFVAYQDLCGWILGRLGLRPRPVRSRLLVFVPLGAALYMFVWPSVGRWWAGGAAPRWEWEMSTTRFWETFPGPVVAILTIAVCGFLLVWWLGAKGFCTYGCPYGAFYGLAEKVAPGRIRVTDACDTCGHCTAVCTSNVRVHEEVHEHRMVVDAGCMKTMDCVSACPKDALYFGFGKPSVLTRSRKRRRPAADFSWGEELTMAAAFLGALWAFRSLYNLVPFLFAIGLGVLAAIATMTAWRLVRRADLRFQNTVLRRGGRLTGAGRVALVVCVGYLALGVHSAVVRWETTRGEELAFGAQDPGLTADASRARLEDGLVHLERAESLGLVADSALQKTLGLVKRDLGEPAEAERRLRRALDLHPHTAWPAAAIPLADLLARQGREPEAEQVLRDVLTERPELADAAMMLARLLVAEDRIEEAEEPLRAALARRPFDPAVAVPLAGLRARQGDVAGASELLRGVLERHPDAADARAMLDAVQRGRSP